MEEGGKGVFIAFLVKKCVFRAENDIFGGKSLYKNIQKSVFKKTHFPQMQTKLAVGPCVQEHRAHGYTL